MRSCCVFNSLRLLHFLLFVVHLLSCRPVFPLGHQSSTMWWTNSLCTGNNEDFGTLAEFDLLNFEEDEPGDGVHQDLAESVHRQSC